MCSLGLKGGRLTKSTACSGFCFLFVCFQSVLILFGLVRHPYMGIGLMASNHDIIHQQEGWEEGIWESGWVWEEGRCMGEGRVQKKGDYVLI